MDETYFFYRINFLKVVRLMGYPIFATGIAMFIPFLASIFYGEYAVGPHYLAASIFSVALGGALLQIKKHRSMRYNEVIATICLSYLFTTCLSALAMLGSGFSIFDAFFEAVSGITTTGLSIIEDWESVPMTTFFARSWLQWVGGLGIMLFSLAFMVYPGSIAKKMKEAQFEGNDLIGGSRALARGVLQVYIILTLLSIAAFLATGMGISDTLIFAFTSVSTGGFAPYSDSIVGLSYWQQGIYIFFALACAVSLPFYYRIWKTQGMIALQGIQLVGIIVLAIATSIVLGGGFSALINALSVQTTTGFFVTDLTMLLPAQKIWISVMMLIGGGVGSTAGGFKVLRLILVFVAVKTYIIRLCQTKSAHYSPGFFSIPVEQKMLEMSMIYVILYIGLAICTWLAFVLYQFDPVDSLFAVSSALGTVGLSAGMVGGKLPVLLKLLLCVDMLAGRLEIIPWLIMLFPKNWIGEKLEVK